MEALIKKWHDHGLAVNHWYNSLLESPDILGCHPVIDWFNSYVPIEGIELYHINHDCGKPYCIEYDADGKAHYPNHSEVSYKVFLERYDEPEFAEMIRHDMGFHKLKGEELEQHCKLPFADHLYATAWAELFANAEIFGGFESESFKIKKKKLVKSLKYLMKE
jgi:hypothetical protein